MGVELSLQLSHLEKHQIRSLLASEPPSSKRAIRLRIILELANGKKKVDIAKECDVSLKTVWKTEHRFLVFGLHGIVNDAPRIGVNRILSGDRIDELLKYPLHNNPINSARWTGTELADRLGFKKSTLYNFLRQRSIRLDNPMTLRGVCIEDGSSPEEVVAVFLSPSISIIIFAWNYKQPLTPSDVMRYMILPHEENMSSFYRKTCNSLIELLEDARTVVSSKFGKGLESTDVSLFLSLSKGRMRNRRTILLASGPKSSMAWKRVEMHCAKNPQIYLEAIKEEWLEFINKEFHRPQMMTKLNILRLENLEGNLKEWLTGIGNRTGTFFWIDPFIQDKR